MAKLQTGRSKSRTVLVVLSAFLLMGETCDPDDTAPVGAINGVFGVSDTGAATYSIPLVLPPGIGSAIPSLSIVYRSDAGDGLLGMGMSLQGLSAISRCARNAHLDNSVGGIEFGPNDAWCLDGSRLISIGPNAYRLEEEQFTRIESFGTAGNGPAWFRVTTRDGLQREYGGTADSRIEGQGLTGPLVGSVRAYALNKLTDLSGNYYTVEYTEDVANGDYRPQKILYSANDAAGEPAKGHIFFGYEDRPFGDAAMTDRHHGPARVSSPKRLVWIQTWILNGLLNVVREYRLAYEPVLSERLRSRLSSVQECQGFLAGAPCRPATTFTWADGFAGIDSDFSTNPQDHITELLSNDAFLLSAPLTGDFDADGVSDLYMVSDQDQFFCSGREMQNGAGCTQTHTDTWVSDWDFYPGDYDGDGATDVLFVSKTDGSSMVCPASYMLGGSSCVAVAFPWETNDAFHPGDYDGDSRTDLLVLRNGLQTFCSGLALTNSGECTTGALPNWPANAEVHRGDYNGDGVVDILAVDNGTATHCDGRQLASPGSHPCGTYTTTGNWLQDYDLYAGDYNGDSQEDLFVVSDTETLFCAGPGIASAENCVRTDDGSQAWRQDFDFYIGDFNGDGTTDIGRVDDSGVDFCQGPYITMGFACVRVVDQAGLREPEVGVLPGDFNGDAVPDFLILEPGLREAPISGYVCDIASISNQYTLPFSGVSTGGNSFTATYRYTQSLALQSPFPDASNTCHYEGTKAARSQMFHVLPEELSVPGSLERIGLNVFGKCHPPGFGTVNVNVDLVPFTHTRTASNQGTWTLNETTFADFEGFTATIFNGATFCPCSCQYDVTTGAVTLNAPSQTHLDTRPANFVTVTGQVPTLYVKLAEGRMGPIDVATRIHVGIGEDVTAIGSGYGVDYDVTYAALTNLSGNVYTKGNGAVYPERDVQAPIFVVQSVTMPDGLGTFAAPTKYTQHYTYEGLRSDTTRRRSLGFERIKVTDSRPASPEITREFRQDGVLAGRLARQSVHNDGILISEQEVTWGTIASDACSACEHPIKQVEVVKSFEPDGTPTVTKTTTRVNFDLYGNPQYEFVSRDNNVTGVSTEYGRLTEFEYHNDTTNWALGLPTLLKVTGQSPQGFSELRSQVIGYDPQGRILATVANLGDQTSQLTTTYTRNAHGLPTQIGQYDLQPDTADRVQLIRYDVFGLPEEYEDSFGQVTRVLHSRRHGLLRQEIDPNGSVRNWGYDGFGRPIRTWRVGHENTTFSYEDCYNDCSFPAGALITHTETVGAIPTSEVFDMMGRVIGVRTVGSNGLPALQTTTRDTYGRVVAETELTNGVNYMSLTTSSQYDVLDRITQISRPGLGRTTNYTYGPMTVTETTPDPGEGPRVTTQTYDSFGNVAKVVDALNNEMTYAYDPFGNMLSATDSESNAVAYTYDHGDRRTHLSDPTFGEWDLEHNGFGDLVLEKSVNSTREIRSAYDGLGRISTRTESAFSSPLETWHYVYDTAPNGKGRLHKTHSNDMKQVTTYSYDINGHVAGIEVFSTSPSGETATASAGFNYDPWGRVSSMDMPGFAASYVYEPNGELLSIDAGTQRLWRVSDRDERHQPRHVIFGNNASTIRYRDFGTGELTSIVTGRLGPHFQNLSYTYDALGNVRSRHDEQVPGRDLLETFGYDKLNRLTWSEIAGSPRLYNMYDDIGNPTCMRSESATDCAAGGGAQIGYSGTFGPHAATSVSHTPNAGLNVAGQTGTFEATFEYDLDGYQTVRRDASAAPSRVLTHNILGRPQFIWAPTGSSAQLAYNVDQEVVWQENQENGSTVSIFRPFPGYTRWTVDGATEHRVTLETPDGNQILYKTPDLSDAFDNARVFYVHTDPIGSATVVSDWTGDPIEERAYDAFGRHRDPGTGALVAPSVVSQRHTSLSFTGQTEEPGFTLYNYGARHYDPTIGRFLEPDTVIPRRLNMQAFNRYTYGLNDPVNTVDDTGNVPVTFTGSEVLHLRNGGSIPFFPGERFDVTPAGFENGVQVYLFVSLTGRPSLAGAPSIFLAQLTRAASGSVPSGIVRPSAEPSMVGFSGGDVQRDIDDLIEELQAALTHDTSGPRLFITAADPNDTRRFRPFDVDTEFIQTPPIRETLEAFGLEFLFKQLGLPSLSDAILGEEHASGAVVRRGKSIVPALAKGVVQKVTAVSVTDAALSWVDFFLDTLVFEPSRRSGDAYQEQQFLERNPNVCSDLCRSFEALDAQKAAESVPTTGPVDP